jgi:hypothetical protein
MTLFMLIYATAAEAYNANFNSSLRRFMGWHWGDGQPPVKKDFTDPEW